jgi:hypothetical protein
MSAFEFSLLFILLGFAVLIWILKSDNANTSQDKNAQYNNENE